MPTTRDGALHASSLHRSTGAILNTFTGRATVSGECGPIPTVLDKTKGRIPSAQKAWAVTGRLAIKARRPVPLDQELTIAGEPTRSRSRVHEAQG